MNRQIPKNIAASIRQRLLNRAKMDHRPFNELLQYYSMERFLYRMSQSTNADRFILKGALMLRVWQSPEIRPTMDIDMLGKTKNEETSIMNQIREIISVDVEPDGLKFDANSIRAERITKDADYEGIRIHFKGWLDTARINMQIDIGFGDVIYPGPEEADMPTILDSPTPRLLCYSRESAIAEKFETMVKLGSLNSRMKDFYDIWLLSRQFHFHGDKLSQAVRLTFKQRGTSLSENVVAFSSGFASDKQIQWNAFYKKLNQNDLPESFIEIAKTVKTFLTPIVQSIILDKVPPIHWQAPGPWE